MSEHDVLLGENFPHKVSAEYDTQELADQAVRALVNNARLPRKQIRVVTPHDPNMALKVEPEISGIGKTLVKSHIVFGLGGLVVGLGVAALLVTIGPALTRSSPLMTFIALGFVCTSLGLIFAGVLSLRPDHDSLIQKTRTATDSGHWTVIAHCASGEEQDRVKATIGYTAQTL